MSAPQKDGGPAFPYAFENDWHTNIGGFAPGMTLRDWFAGQALAGVSANPDNGLRGDTDAASWCYDIADEMLAARERKGGAA